MSDSLEQARARFHSPLSIPPIPWEHPQQTPQGPLPGQGVFAAMSPEEQFWFHLLMGQGIGQPLPGGAVNPYYTMNLLSGPQGSIYPPQEEG